jgi:serine/threonine-protein kinase
MKMKSFNYYWNWFLNSWLYRPAILFIILLVIGIIADQLLMPYYIKLGDEIEMPDVIEMHVDEAQKMLTENGFNVLVRDSLYDAFNEIGTVIEQNPYPYALVKEGRRVYLSISIGEKPILMPNLFGVSPREAELILETYGLVLRARNYVYSDMYHEGTVMGQSYPPGQEIKAGSKINITISLGKLKKEMQIPNLVGKSLYEARERLRKLGVEIGDLTYQERDNILPETVLSQSIEPGTSVTHEDKIDLVVSKGKSE